MPWCVMTDVWGQREGQGGRQGLGVPETWEFLKPAHHLWLRRYGALLPTSQPCSFRRHGTARHPQLQLICPPPLLHRGQLQLQLYGNQCDWCGTRRHSMHVHARSGRGSSIA